MSHAPRPRRRGTRPRVRRASNDLAARRSVARARGLDAGAAERGDELSGKSTLPADDDPSLRTLPFPPRAEHAGKPFDLVHEAISTRLDDLGGVTDVPADEPFD